MELTKAQQQKRASKLLKYQEEPDLTKLEMLLELDESMEDKHEETMKCLNEMMNKEMPKPIDHTEQLQTIIDKLNEPEEDEEIEVTLNII